MRYGDEPHHLIGTTLHNIGVLQLWQKRYKEAWENFNQAATIRMQSLSKNHPDIAVRTLSRLWDLVDVDEQPEPYHFIVRFVGFARERSYRIVCSRKVE